MRKIALGLASITVMLAALTTPAQAAPARNYVVAVQHCRGQRFTALPAHRTWNGAWARNAQVARNWRVRAVEVTDTSGSLFGRYLTHAC